jgi:hypothetical protein
VLRTAVSMTAAAIAATCALAACGPLQMGSAAIMGDQRTSVTALSDKVANLKQWYQAHRSKIQLQYPLSQAPQEVLAWLVRFRVRDEMATRNHVKVSTGQSERALNAIAAQAGATGIKNLAVANGLPPDLLPELGRYEAIQNALVGRMDGGTLPKSTAAQQALGTELSRRQCRAAKALNIRINPQFGRLDYSQFSIIPAATALSAPVTPSPSPTAAPALKPPC